MTYTFTILGCGSSSGVPRVGAGWGACDPANPKNRRRRCSLLVERTSPAGTTRVLIDTSPDLREQLLDAGVDRLDAVLFTHEHADHTHGIDDLRPLVLHQRRRIDVYADEPTSASLHARFDYCFTTPAHSSYPPILNARPLAVGTPVIVSGQGDAIGLLPFKLEHGDIPALGFRIGGLAYTPDLNGIPDASLEALSDLDIWIIDALRYNPHPTHLTVDQALAWIARMQPRRAIITNMHVDIDHATLGASLPPGVEAAFDGMRITMP